MNEECIFDEKNRDNVIMCVLFLVAAFVDEDSA